MPIDHLDNQLLTSAGAETIDPSLTGLVTGEKKEILQKAKEAGLDGILEFFLQPFPGETNFSRIRPEEDGTVTVSSETLIEGEAVQIQRTYGVFPGEKGAWYKLRLDRKKDHKDLVAKASPLVSVEFFGRGERNWNLDIVGIRLNHGLEKYPAPLLQKLKDAGILFPETLETVGQAQMVTNSQISDVEFHVYCHDRVVDSGNSLIGLSRPNKPGLHEFGIVQSYDDVRFSINRRKIDQSQAVYDYYRAIQLNMMKVATANGIVVDTGQYPTIPFPIKKIGFS